MTKVVIPSVEVQIDPVIEGYGPQTSIEVDDGETILIHQNEVSHLGGEGEKVIDEKGSDHLSGDHHIHLHLFTDLPDGGVLSEKLLLDGEGYIIDVQGERAVNEGVIDWSYLPPLALNDLHWVGGWIEVLLSCLEVAQ